MLTGSTGLLGRYLLRDLLESGQRLALLVRGSKRETASDRVEAILQYWERLSGKSLARPVLLEGDIRKPCLGLSGNDKRWVANHCTSMMHSAASLTFHADGTGEPWHTNFDGTRNMLDLCDATGLRKLHYVSTAYVCGLRQGRILETEVDCGQSFRNDYEESKLRAEMMVRNADFIDELTVYRPAVISGDSKTGYTNTYHGIYLYLRLMALMAPRQPIGPDGKRITRLRLPVQGDERRNVIPVDWVSKVMTHLFLNPEAHGHTFNLAPDVCLTARQLTDAGYTFFNSTGVEYVGYEHIDPATYNDLEAATLPGLAMYNNYESTDPTFDCTNLKRFASQLPCPPIDEAMIHTYIQYGEEDRWGKRRSEAAVVPWHAADYFREFQVADDISCGNTISRVSIDLVGPGGGQWTLGLLQDGTLTCIAGVHTDADSLLKLSVAEFRKLVACPKDSKTQHAIEQLFPMSSVMTFEPLAPSVRERVS